MHTDPKNHGSNIEPGSPMHTDPGKDQENHQENQQATSQDQEPEQEQEYNNDPKPALASPGDDNHEVSPQDQPEATTPIMPLQITYDQSTLDEELASDLEIDHESPGFVHEAMSPAPDPPQERRDLSFHIHNLAGVTHYWKTTDDFAGDPKHEEMKAWITKWSTHPERKIDPDETIEDHIPWLTTAILYFAAYGGEQLVRAEAFFAQLMSERDTRYYLTALACNTQAAHIPQIDPTGPWSPTVPIPDVTGREELQYIMDNIKQSWLIHNESILEKSMAEFLLAFAIQAGIRVQTLLQWIEENSDASEAAQVMIIRHWQNWLYYRQFPIEELPQLEQNVHPYPIILNPEEARLTLLNMEHIATQAYTPPVARADEGDY